MEKLSSSNEHSSAGHTVIDLRTGLSADRRIRELARPGTDPGWIAGILNREGIPSSSDRPWSPEDVLAVLSHRTPA